MQLPPPVHGQSMVNSFINSSQLIKSKFEYRVISLNFADLLNMGHISLKKLTKMIKYMLVLLYQLILYRPDLIYFTISHKGGAFYRDCLYVLILKTFRCRIVYHLHGKGIKENLDNFWKKKLYKLVFKNTTAIVLADILRYDVEAIDSNCSIFTVANGIPKATLPQPDKRGKVRLLYLSNLVLTKGVFVLIEALNILKERCIEFEAVFVGDKVKSIPIEVFWGKIKAYGLENYVKYLGPLYGDEKNIQLVNADIFVFPTYNDCFPLVILESMRAGIPIVSTVEGAIPNIVDDGITGFLVQKMNTMELADRLEELISNDELRVKMGKKGLQKFEQNYTVDVFEKKLVALLTEVASL